MSILFIALGIVMVVGGFACMFTPIATLLSVGYIIGVLMLAYGIVGIIRCVQEKEGAFGWILSILAVIVGILAIVKPGGTLVIDSILLFALAAFFLVQGVILVVTAIQSRNYNSGWIWPLIVGLLSVILGIYSFVHPKFTAVTVGILIGLWFVEAGFGLITLSLLPDDSDQ